MGTFDGTVARIVADVVGCDDGAISRETTLASLGIDEYDVTEIAGEIDYEWEIEISEAEVAACKTIGELADLVRGRLSEGE